MTTQLRMLAGGSALFAGILIVTGVTAAPPLAGSSYKKAAEADIAQLQKHLMVCDGDAKEAKRYGPTAKSLTMMLVMYAEASGDKALKEQALKVNEAMPREDRPRAGGYDRPRSAGSSSGKRW